MNSSECASSTITGMSCSARVSAQTSPTGPPPATITRAFGAARMLFLPPLLCPPAPSRLGHAAPHRRAGAIRRTEYCRQFGLAAATLPFPHHTRKQEIFTHVYNGSRPHEAGGRKCRGGARTALVRRARLHRQG